MRRPILPLLFVLAACQGDGSSRQNAGAAEAGTAAAPAPLATIAAEGVAAASAAPLVALDGEGLRLVLQSGATRLLAFGAPRAQAERALGGSLGTAERSEMAECGAGPLGFTRFGPLQLVFQDGVFVGWLVDGAGNLSTMDGLAIGSTAAHVQAARKLERISGSTLGEEFTLGSRADEGPAIGGLFAGAGPDARVTALFAGTTCFFR